MPADALRLQMELEDLDEDLRDAQKEEKGWSAAASKVQIGGTFAVSCNPDAPAGFAALRAELVRLGEKQGRFLPNSWANILNGAHAVRARRLDLPRPS